MLQRVQDPTVNYIKSLSFWKIAVGVLYIAPLAGLAIRLLPKMLYDKFMDNTESIELSKVLEDGFTKSFEMMYMGTKKVISFAFAKFQNGMCSVTSTADEVINLSPCLLNVTYAKEYVAIHDLKNMGISLAHVIGTTILSHHFSPKKAIAAFNVMVAGFDGNLLNSLAGLQVIDKASIFSKIAFPVIEGVGMLMGIGISHNSFVREHPYNAKDFVGSYKQMKDDAFTLGCTDEDQYHYALHEYFCPNEVN